MPESHELLSSPQVKTPRSDTLSLLFLTADSKPASDDSKDRLAATLSVLGGGLRDGVVEKGKEALSDPMSLVKLGGSMAIGAAFAVANSRQGLLRLGARVGMVGLGGAFAVDVYKQGAQTVDALKDTWNNPGNARENRERVAKTLGPLVIDTALFSAGGGAGVGVAQRFLPKPVRLLSASVSAEEVASGSSKAVDIVRASEKPILETPKAKSPSEIEFHILEQGKVFNPEATLRVPVTSALGRTVKVARGSVAKVEVLKLNSSGELAGGSSTGVAVSADGKLVVNKHLVDDAVSISVFDSQMRAHPAHVLRVNPDKEVDLAILQLDIPSSFSKFKPIKFSHADALKPGEQVAFLGHPEGHNALFVSPGSVASKGRGVTATFHANVREGNCGSAICNMDGQLLAVMKSEGSLVNGTPISMVKSLLESNAFATGNKAPNFAHDGIPHIQKFEVKEPKLAVDAIEKIFGITLSQRAPSDFYHARARRATYQNETSQGEILLKTEYMPRHREVVIRPAAKDGQPLTSEMFWPGTRVPINTAALRLRFSDGFQKVDMRSVNDPYNILTAGFELRGRFFTYLSQLKPM